MVMWQHPSWKLKDAKLISQLSELNWGEGDVIPHLEFRLLDEQVELFPQKKDPFSFWI